MSGERAVRAFQKAGWVKDRQRGSHVILVKPGHAATLSVPQHRELAPGTLRALIRAAGTFETLPPNKIKSLWVQMSRNGWRTQEPHALSPEPPSIIDQALKVHFKQHGYSNDELASVVDLFPAEFSALYGASEPRLRAVT